MVSLKKLHQGMLLTKQVIFKVILLLQVKLSLIKKIPFFNLNIIHVFDQFNSIFLIFEV